MLGGFQDYLIDKGWKRYTKDRNLDRHENYTSNFLSGYGPATYFFSNDNFPGLEFWYGLAERGKPPCFSIYPTHISYISDNYKTIEDLYRIVLSKIDYDILYDIISKQDRYFEITEDDNNTIIKIITSIL